MAVTNRYDVFKNTSSSQLTKAQQDIDAFKGYYRVYAGAHNEDDGYRYFDGSGNRVYNRNKWLAMRSASKAGAKLLNDYNKQKSDYYKTFGSAMLEGASSSVGSAVVDTNSVPVNRTDPILSIDTGFTGKKKKKGSDASALGL